MLLFIRVLGCTRGVFMNTFKLTQPRMLWLDQRLTSSVAFHRLKPAATTIGATPVTSISLPGKNIVVLPCSRYRALHTPAGRARIITNTHGALASSSAASSPTPAESLKAQTVPTTTVPLDDVKRILKLAQSERCRLAGNGVSLLKVCLFKDVMRMSYQRFSVTPAAVGFLTISSAVTMSAPFFLGKVIDTIYGSEIDADTMTASLTSLCITLTGVFLCGSAANAARVYLMQVSGEIIS